MGEGDRLDTAVGAPLQQRGDEVQPGLRPPGRGRVGPDDGEPGARGLAAVTAVRAAMKAGPEPARVLAASEFDVTDADAHAPARSRTSSRIRLHDDVGPFDHGLHLVTGGPLERPHQARAPLGQVTQQGLDPVAGAPGCRWSTVSTNIRQG